MDGFVIALFGLAPAIAWGLSGYLYAKGSQKFGSLKAALAVNSSGALAYCLMYLLFLRDDATFSTEGIVYTLAGSLLFGLAQIMYSKSLRIGPVSLAAPISNTYPLFTLIVGLLFLSVDVSMVQVLGIVVIVLGGYDRLRPFAA